MNPRILVAFAAGAMVASGIVFTAIRPGSHSAPSTFTISPKRAVAPAPLPEPSAPPMPSAPASPAPLPVAVVQSSTQIIHVQAHSARPKPSAMPVAVKKWPADKAEPVLSAQSQPPVPVQASPAPEQPMPVEQSVVQPAAPEPELPRAADPVPAAEPERQQPHTVTLRPGTLLSVRMGQTLSTRNTQPGDSFFANFDQPLVIDGWVIAERGARAVGRVIDSGPGGRVQGGGELGLQLTAIDTSDGQHIGISTTTFLKRGPSWGNREAATVGGAAALGAAIGAMAGGGKGAAIGAIAGGAAGAGGVVYSRRAGADIPAETRISFRVDHPVSITEKLD